MSNTSRAKGFLEEFDALPLVSDGFTDERELSIFRAVLGTGCVARKNLQDSESDPTKRFLFIDGSILDLINPKQKTQPALVRCVVS